MSPVVAASFDELLKLGVGNFSSSSKIAAKLFNRMVMNSVIFRILKFTKH